MTTPRRPARNQALPQLEVENLHTLRGYYLYRHIYALYCAGWTLRAIGEAFDPPKSRSTIQSWVDKGREAETGQPEVPRIGRATVVVYPEFATPITYVPVKSPSPGIPPADLKRIQELAPIARKFRGAMGPRHVAAQANQELTDLCERLQASGVTITELASAAGVTYRAMAKRLGRA